MSAPLSPQRIFAFIGYFLIFTIIIFLWTLVLCLAVFFALPKIASYTLVGIVCSLFGTGLFIVGLIGEMLTQNRLITILYRIWAHWIGWLSIAGWVASIAVIFAHITGYLYDEWIYVIGFIFIVLVLNIIGIYASYIPRIVRYRITLSGVHKWHGKKIVLISDTHYGNIYGKKHAQKLVDMINSLNPEIVLIPWDFYDGPITDYIWVAEIFRGIHAPHGVYFSNGNHEEYGDVDTMIHALEKWNIHILNNKMITLNGITLAGVTYHNTETAEDLKKELDTLSLSEDQPVILLKHKPTLHKILLDYPIDLVVSGHTHKWQMWPFSWMSYMMFGKYAYGKSVDGDMTSITSSGVGTWWPPQRIGTRSEIVVIEVV